MSEYVIFSDFHAHNFNAYSTMVPFEGVTINSRLRDSIMVLREIREYCQQHGIKTVLFGGDLFHSRSAVQTNVYNLISKEIEAFPAHSIQLIMIPGNHDMADKAGAIHSLQRLVEPVVLGVPVSSCNLAESEGGLGMRGCYPFSPDIVVTVPYTPDYATACARLQRAGELADELRVEYGDALRHVILLAHLGMQGAKVGSDYVLVSDQDIKVSDVPVGKFDACFFGHYHQHQQLFENGWFIGATHHHNWGDADTRRGFLHVYSEPEGIYFKQVETQAAPRFVHVYADNPVTPRKMDFVRYHTDEPTDELAEQLRVTLSPHLEVVGTKKAHTTEEFELTEEQLHPAGMVDAWVEKYGEDYDKDKLKAIGTALLAKAESKGL